MINLNNPKWKTFKGGYKVLYDASIRLKELEATNNSKKVKGILKELWNELHHQGDVDLASYFSLPHLVRIGIDKKLELWDIPALIAVIEIQRHENNPPFPKEYEEEYKNEIKKVTQLIKINQNKKWDRTYSIAALSAMAAVNEQIDLAKLILKLEDSDILEKFELLLEHYDEFTNWMKKK